MARFMGGLVAAALAAAPATMPAQERPDFSGRWSAAAPQQTQGFGAGGPRSTAQSSMGSGWGDEIEIQQAGGWLTVQSFIFAPGDLQPPLKRRFALNGTRHKNRLLMGYDIMDLESRAAWKGDTLVITTVHPFRHPDNGTPMQAEVTQSLSLSSTNNLVRFPSLVVDLAIPAVLGGPPSTYRTVFTRR